MMITMLKYIGIFYIVFSVSDSDNEKSPPLMHVCMRAGFKCSHSKHVAVDSTINDVVLKWLC